MHKQMDIILRNRRASEYINRKRKEKKHNFVVKIGWLFVALTLISVFAIH